MIRLDPLLAARLRAIGHDPATVGDPDATWRRLRDRFGPRITLVDRYALEAQHLGVQPDELPVDLRKRIGDEVLRIQFPGLEFMPASQRSVRDVIRVVPYDPGWPRRFAALRSLLVAELGASAVRIEHVGSTAVPGLAAKPTIDVQVSVADAEDESAYVPGIERAVSPLRSREPGHRYFRPSGGSPRDAHVHVCDAGSDWERDHLLFRDYLRVHSVARNEYARLKHTLAKQYGDDRLVYTDAKSAFILDTLDEARAWAVQTGWELPPSPRLPGD